jgi:hypothetical protein
MVATWRTPDACNRLAAAESHVTTAAAKSFLTGVPPIDNDAAADGPAICSPERHKMTKFLLAGAAVLSLMTGVAAAQSTTSQTMTTTVPTSVAPPPGTLSSTTTTKSLGADRTRTETNRTTYRNSDGVEADSATKTITYLPPAAITTTRSTTTTTHSRVRQIGCFQSAPTPASCACTGAWQCGAHRITRNCTIEGPRTHPAIRSARRGTHSPCRPMNRCYPVCPIR